MSKENFMSVVPNDDKQAIDLNYKYHAHGRWLIANKDIYNLMDTVSIFQMKLPTLSSLVLSEFGVQ